MSKVEEIPVLSFILEPLRKLQIPPVPTTVLLFGLIHFRLYHPNPHIIIRRTYWTSPSHITVVASLLTAGCLANYRSGNSQTIVHASKLLTDHRPSSLPVFFGKQLRIPDTERFRRNIASRFLAYFPFLMEVWYWLLT